MHHYFLVECIHGIFLNMNKSQDYRTEVVYDYYNSHAEPTNDGSKKKRLTSRTKA